MTRGTGLIFSLSNAALGLLYVQCIFHALTSALLCVPLIFADSIDLVVALGKQKFFLHNFKHICVRISNYAGILDDSAGILALTARKSVIP